MCIPEILLQLPSQGEQRQHCIRLFLALDEETDLPL